MASNPPIPDEQDARTYGPRGSCCSSGKLDGILGLIQLR